MVKNLFFCAPRKKTNQRIPLINRLYKVIFYNLVFLNLLAVQAHADGSKDLYPSTIHGHRSFLMSSSNITTAGWPFMEIATQYVYAKTGETVATASSAQGLGAGIIRLTAPDGAIYSSTVGDATNGNIANRTQEMAGPNVGAVTTGYTPFTKLVSATQTGVWKVEFLPTRVVSPTVLLSTAGIGGNANATWTGQNVNSNAIRAWDISVIGTDGTTLIPGRAYALVMNMYNDLGYFSSVYVLTNDGYVYQVNNNGIVALGFAYFVNNKGITDGNNDGAKPTYKSVLVPSGPGLTLNIKDPRSADGLSSVTHKIFYTYPDAGMPASAPYAGGTTWLRVPKVIPAVSGITINGVEGTAGQVSTKGATLKFQANMPGTYRIKLSGPPSFVTRELNGSAVSGNNTLFWDGKDGAGNFAPPGDVIINVKVVLQGAEVHFPFLDVENNTTGIIIEQLNDDGSKKPGGDNIYWDDSNFATAAGASNPQINGNSGTGAASNSNGHIWSNAFGDARAMDTWTYILGDAISEDAHVAIKVADLAVQAVTTTAVAPVIIGSNDAITYTVPVVNNGPSDVTGAAFKFKVPTGFIIANATTAVTYVTSCGAVGNAAIDASGNYTALLDLPNGCLITFSITGKLGLTYIGANLGVEASIMRPADTTDPDATNPNTSVSPTDPHVECLNGTAIEGCNNIKYNTLTVSSTADIVVVKSTAATAYIPGEEVVYTLVVKNDGPSDASAVNITDLAPAGTTISSWTAVVTTGTVTLPAANGAGNLNQTIAVFPNAAVVTYTVTLIVDATHTADLINTASATSANITDPDLTNNTSTTTAIAYTPDAPISGGNVAVCASSPLQTITATATVPSGITITWYDAPIGGNVIVNPVLSALGTVVYYAEANHSGNKSRSRTPVILSINVSPKIDVLANQAACVNYTLPVITGTNLTGNQAYYTQPNGGGTKYIAGALMNTVGTQTLYIFDKAIANTACTGDITVTTNTTLSDNVFIHQALSTNHNYYPRAIDPNFWTGIANQPITYNSTEGATRYLTLVGDLNIGSNPLCTSNQVEISVGATFKNEGPSAGAGYSGHVSIANKLTGEIIYTSPIQPDFHVGATASYTATAIVNAADLLAGNLMVMIGAETAQSGYKNWTISGFKATYKYVSETPCPDETSFQLTINALPTAPVNTGNQEVCATNPIQTLTATASVPVGATVVWYDAAVGGNLVAAPTLNTVGTIIYYAESVSNTCTSTTRTPVILTINQSPIINAIADLDGCGSVTLPAITGTNLSGNQAYYTGINKTGSRYIAGDVITALGETTLYAYDEKLLNAVVNPTLAMTYSNITNAVGGYTNAKLQALYPNATRGFPLTGSANFKTSTIVSLLGLSSPAKFSVIVARLALPVGYVNAGDQVLVSLNNAFIRNVNSIPLGVAGYAGQMAIINIATNQLLYQTTFNDVPTTGVRPSLAGLVSAADLIAGNIGIYIEFGLGTWRESDLVATYQFVDNAVGCPAQQSFKVNVNAIPVAPVASNQTACANSPIQTLTAIATVVPGATVVWYDAATAGNVVAAPTLSTAGTITYYAETHTATCVSATRTAVVLTINAPPVLSIHNPAIVCHPGTINITLPAVTTGSTAGLAFTYFKDAAATVVLANPTTLAISGTYYIKGRNTVTGCSTIAPIVVQFVDKPEVTAVHPDCVSATGSITITSPLGTGFEYSIDNGAHYQAATVFNNLAAATYNVRARHTSVAGCESDVNVVIINATPTTATPLVLQPDCDQTEGSIEFPVNAAYEYSIDGGTFSGGNVFTGLSVGPHTIRSKKAGDACVADPVLITIVATIGHPNAPTATDQQACAMSVVQTLTATANVAPGSTVVWYDAAMGGNLVTSPTLNVVGTIVYYAESFNGTCSSINRTAVRLTITAAPIINAISDKNVCGSLVLPAITGSNLSGNQAYYTAINGGGTKYNAGDAFSTLGQTTLYAYDVTAIALPGTSCPAQVSFTVLIRNTTAGTITADQVICKSSVPVVLASTADGTGSGTLKYRWESSTTSASTGFNTITGSTLATYAPTALTTTNWFRRITISSYNGVDCESAPTTAVKITVQDAVTAGTISASQTVCNGSSPSAFISVTDATGSGTLSYRWESSTTDALTGFSAISGATLAGYNPSALTATTWFRRVAISTDGGNSCESVPTAVVKVTLQTAVTAGVISTDQTVCNTTSTTLTSVTSGTGSGAISYRWESSTTNALSGFNPIAGTITEAYTASALTTTTWFRRITQSTQDGIICESVPTAATSITVQDIPTAGAISADQTICAASTPVAFASITAGTGSGTISYRWEQSSASVPAFTVIPGAIATTYTSGILTETTWFRRITISSLNGVLCESAPTALLEVTVQDEVTTGSISADQTICNGSTPATLTSVSSGTGSGTITYRWESSTTSATTGFGTIAGATLATYSPVALTATTYFRRITISTTNWVSCESLPSTTITITVQDAVTKGAIATDQTICYNSVPTTLTSTTDGTGSGTITYRWESSTTSATTGFGTIAGATLATYSPVALTATTYFRRITISTTNGVSCESLPSTAITITVQDAVTKGAIATDQTICYNSVPTALTSTTDGTGSGTITYRWESSTTSATTGFGTIAGATLATYSPVALSATTYFRRITISTTNGISCESLPSAVVKITVVPQLSALAGDDQQSYNNEIFTLTANSPSTGTGKWTIVSGTLAEAMTADSNPTGTVKLLPNTTVTLRWTVSEATCSIWDEVVLTYDSEADIRTIKTTKTTGKTTYVPGEAVVYTISVTNNGPSDATAVNIKDTSPAGTTISTWTAVVTSGTVVLPSTSGTGNLNETLAKLPNGATVSYEITVQTPTSFINNLVNTVQVTTVTPDPDPICTTCTTLPLSPNIDAHLKLWKNDTYEDTNGDGKVNAGDLIRYTFKVQNTGNVTIKNITINDTKVTVIGSLASLAAGTTDVSTFSASYIITQTDMDKGGVYNLATVIGKDPAGTEITAESVDPTPLDPSDPANPPVLVSCPACTITPLKAIPSITLVKTVSNTGTGTNGIFQLDDLIQYRFVITNTGNVTLNNITLSDPLISAQVINITGSLAPGAFTQYTATYKVLRSDADRGKVVNQATVNAKDPSGKNVDDLSGTAANNNDATQTIIANVAPIATNDQSIAESGKPVIIKVMNNDLPGTVALDPSSIEIMANPLHGTVTKNLDGTFTYTSIKGYTGTDSFTYRIKDVNGNWSNVATVLITIHANALLVPSVFTPNGDGKNDRFEITGLEAYQKVSLLIFNRWGNEVYRNVNYKNEWDGLGLNEGTYYYILNLEQGNKTEILKGWILIKR